MITNTTGNMSAPPASSANFPPGRLADSAAGQRGDDALEAQSEPRLLVCFLVDPLKLIWTARRVRALVFRATAS